MRPKSENFFFATLRQCNYTAEHNSRKEKVNGEKKNANYLRAKRRVNGTPRKKLALGINTMLSLEGCAKRSEDWKLCCTTADGAGDCRYLSC